MNPIRNFDELLSRASRLESKAVVVASAESTETLSAVKDARKLLGTKFILIGNRETIEKNLIDLDVPFDGIEIRNSRTPSESIEAAVQAIAGGEGAILLKGSIDTTSLMKAVLARESGLRMGRTLSDVFLFEFPPRKEKAFIMISDGGLNVLPDVNTKIEIIENAVQVAHALGNPNPKVALLSASEFILPNIPSSVEAAEITRIFLKRENRGCEVFGPLALDNALSSEAAGIKKIDSPVAGAADILIAPNIEAANCLAKSTTYFSNLRLAHVIMGAKIPILIPSRSDKSDAKLLSIALGMVMSDFKETE